MANTLADTIIKLSAADGPSGFEQDIGKLAAELMMPYMDEVTTDVMGNVIGVKRCGKENAPKLMFDAHLDEIGFVVTGHEEGFLRFAALGGVDARMLPASELRILTDPPVIGIVDALPPHIQKPEESDKTIKIEELFIDVGLSKEDAQKRIPVGTPAVYHTGARCFGDALICGKAQDDRSCFAVILHALELLKDEKLDVDLYVLASAQEEVGTRGAQTGAFSVRPDWCIVVDVDHAKTPDHTKYDAMELGAGVVVSKGPNMNRKLTDKAIDLAEQNNIKYQVGVEASGNSGTNARVIQVAGEGVATALFGLPLKYMHSPVEVISLEDAEAAARLLSAVAKEMKGEDVHA